MSVFAFCHSLSFTIGFTCSRLPKVIKQQLNISWFSYLYTFIALFSVNFI